jgi:hypothetical protein
LAAAKRPGVKLGNPRLQAGTEATALAASKAASETARARVEELRELVEDARSKGCTSLRALANHLNSLDIRTPRGGTWAAASVGGSCRVGRLIQAGISHSITRGGAGFLDRGISGFLTGHDRRNEIHEEAQT